ncbi:MAG: hypothetical protein ACQESR_02860, partial [Planctomycetota bacterium]
CHLYVDLNQIHAGLADSLPDSRHSGICNRIAADERTGSRGRSELVPRDWLLPRGVRGSGGPHVMGRIG